MSIGPILPGRIPSSLIASRLQANIQSAQRSLTDLQAQVATGQRFFKPSEDPSASIRTIVLQRLIERKTQMQSNVRTDKGFLNVSESSMNTVSDSLNRAKTFLLAGVGSTSSPEEKEAMAVETRALIDSVVNAANSRFNGRYLFAGSESQTLPFTITEGGLVRYNGDKQDIDSFIDVDFLQANNVQGDFTFSALTKPITKDVDPALTLDTKIDDLHGGDGVPLGSIDVTVDDGVNPVAVRTVDISAAETIRDIKTLVEDAFQPGPPTLTIDIDPGSNNGFRFTPSGGTVAVVDQAGSTVARDLGIASAAVAVINGGDLDPQMTLLTPLSAFNNGAGIGATAGNGLYITNGNKTQAVDISTANTVEDLFNILESEDLDLSLDLNDTGNGLAITSRLSGANFMIGENNGLNATGLGIRTMTAETLLSDLNLGRGVPTDGVEDIVINRRDLSQVSVDITGANTIQDVLDAINAVDPGVLVASLNAVGNGITIVDDDGFFIGPLEVEFNNVSAALGIDGLDNSGVSTTPLTGRDVNPIQSEGIFNLLIQLEDALINEDDRLLERIDPLMDKEIERINLVRGDIGVRLKVLEDMEDRLLSDDIELRQALSIEFDADLTEVITQVATVNETLQATLKVAQTSFELSLFSYI